MTEGKTSITIPVDLERVEKLGPGKTWTTMADGDCEVYIVRRWGGGIQVDAFAINADQVHVIAGNLP